MSKSLSLQETFSFKSHMAPLKTQEIRSNESLTTENVLLKANKESSIITTKDHH